MKQKQTDHLATIKAQSEEIRALSFEIEKLKKALRSAQDDLVVEKMSRVNNYANAERLVEWIRSDKRRPANVSFTAGPERQVAYAVEDTAGSPAAPSRGAQYYRKEG